jgi:hypothetical protein
MTLWPIQKMKYKVLMEIFFREFSVLVGPTPGSFRHITGIRPDQQGGMKLVDNTSELDPVLRYALLYPGAHYSIQALIIVLWYSLLYSGTYYCTQVLTYYYTQVLLFYCTQVKVLGYSFFNVHMCSLVCMCTRYYSKLRYSLLY